MTEETFKRTLVEMFEGVYKPFIVETIKNEVRAQLHRALKDKIGEEVDATITAKIERGIRRRIYIDIGMK